MSITVKGLLASWFILIGAWCIYYRLGFICSYSFLDSGNFYWIICLFEGYLETVDILIGGFSSTTFNSSDCYTVLAWATTLANMLAPPPNLGPPKVPKAPRGILLAYFFNGAFGIDSLWITGFFSSKIYIYKAGTPSIDLFSRYFYASISSSVLFYSSLILFITSYICLRSLASWFIASLSLFSMILTLFSLSFNFNSA
jgi:hypothetical protein